MKLFEAYHLLIIIISLSFIASPVTPNIAKKGCDDKCGNVAIPYPFGIGAGCSINQWYVVDCNSSTPYLPSLNHLQLLRVDLVNQIVTVSMPMPPRKISSDCQNPSVVWNNRSETMSTMDLRSSPFVFSTSDNKFVFEGCGGAALMTNDGSLLLGCSATCLINNTVKSNIKKDKCYGVGCCEISSDDIPGGYLNSYSIKITGFEEEEGGCGSAFLVDEKYYYLYEEEEEEEEEELGGGGGKRRSWFSNHSFIPVSLLWMLTDSDHRSCCPGSFAEYQINILNGTVVDTWTWTWTWTCRYNIRTLPQENPFLKDDGCNPLPENKNVKNVTFELRPRDGNVDKLPDKDVNTRKRKHMADYGTETNEEDDDFVPLNKLVKKSQKKNDKDSENEVKKETKEDMTKRGKVISLRTRISPHQLYVVIKKLSKVQVEAVKKMGFGKLLKFNMDSIPSKLAYYIMESFDPLNMEIRLKNGSVKVTEAEITNLLGLNDGGIVLDDKEKRKDEKVLKKAEWAAMYGDGLITPVRVATRISENKEDDGWLFKYDFVTLVMNSLVCVMMDGRCNTDFLNRFEDDTEVEHVNWCAYICSQIKKCKVGWQKGNNFRLYNGPIPILILLYVDMTLCGDLNRDRTMGPLEFWTKEMLSMREKNELNNGGFGLVDIRSSYKEDDSKKEVNMDKSDVTTNGDDGKDDSDKLNPFEMFADRKKVIGQVGEAAGSSTGGKKTHMQNVADLVKAVIQQKDDIKEELGRQYSLNPDDEEVMNVICMYNTVFKDEIKMGKVTRKVDDIVNDVLENLKKDETKDVEKNDIEMADQKNDKNGKKGVDGKKNDIEKGDRRGVKKKKKEVDRTMPSFNLLSDSSQETDVEAEYEIEGIIPINKPLDKDEQMLWKYLTVSMMDKRRIERRTNKKEPKQIDVEQEKKEVELAFMLNMFETEHGMVAKGYTMNSLEFGQELSSNLIDCWASMLNHKEKRMVPTGKRRLFCYTSTFPEQMRVKKQSEDDALRKMRGNFRDVLERDDSLLDLKAFNIVIVPMIEKAHFYLICMDFDTGEIEVIDNMKSSRDVCHTRVSTEFRYMGTPCKLKKYMLSYMESVKHPGRKKLNEGHISRKKIKWETADNVKDCGVFAIRHMECYKGSGAEFECGFSDKKGEKQNQLNNLRMRIATTLMMSPSNVYHKKIVQMAKNVVDKVEEKDILDRFERVEALQKLCWKGLPK